MPNRPILVIDDDPKSCDLVAAILMDADFEVLSAEDGWSGIELARSVQPAVILLDMVMRGIDGISTCEQLKKDPVLRNIPVIGITGSDDLKFTERAFRAGAELFLPKPFQARSLVNVVELALGSTSHRTDMHRRRRHLRLPASVTARCRIGGEVELPRVVVGRTSNVSLGGLLVCLPEVLTSGTRVRLGLNLPDGTITAKGTVRWQTPESRDDQGCGHGIRISGFVEDFAPFRYRRFLSQVAADRGAWTHL